MAKAAKDEAVDLGAVEGASAPVVYIVAKRFSDNPTIQPDRSQAVRYEVGDDVTDMDPKRLADLVTKGYVKPA